MFVPSTFLIVTGLSSFYSLNPCLATIFLFMNIPVVLLSKSAFIVIPLCVSTFSIPIFSYTSLSILNILFASLCLFPFLLHFLEPLPMYCSAVLFSVQGILLPPQFYHGCFFSVLYSRHQIFFLFSSNIFSSTIVFFPLHFVHLTLLPASLFLYFHASKQFSHHTFFSLSPETKPCSWFSSVLVPL